MPKHIRTAPKTLPALPTDRTELRKRAKELWEGSKGTLTGQAIADALDLEGYGRVDSGMIRTYKKRDKWPEFERIEVATKRKAVKRAKKVAEKVEAALDVIVREIEEAKPAPAPEPAPIDDSVPMPEPGEPEPVPGTPDPKPGKPPKPTVIVVDLPKSLPAAERLEAVASSLTRSAVELGFRLQATLRTVDLKSMDDCLEAARIMSMMADSLGKIDRLSVEQTRRSTQVGEFKNPARERAEAEEAEKADKAEADKKKHEAAQQERPLAGIIASFRGARTVHQ